MDIRQFVGADLYPRFTTVVGAAAARPTLQFAIFIALDGENRVHQQLHVHLDFAALLWRAIEQHDERINQEWQIVKHDVDDGFIAGKLSFWCLLQDFYMRLTRQAWHGCGALVAASGRHQIADRQQRQIFAVHILIIG